MALQHATAGQKIGIPLLGSVRDEMVTKTLFKTAELEVMRMVVLKGKLIPTHKLARSITLQCLEGRVAVSAMGELQELTPGHIVFLNGGESHELRGIEDTSLLVTILL